MQTPEAPNPPAGGNLQFDHAEAKNAAAPTVSCSACNQKISDSYYMINESVSCLNCRDQVQAATTGGSRVVRFLRASMAGVVAGAVGSAIYFAILKLTGYEFGLVAIVVGLMVGGAVRWGCDGRGGWFYQLLAMFLTYCAIVTTYIPSVLEEYAKTDPKFAAATWIAKAVVGFVVAFLLPFLAGIQNIIGILIIGFALYEAWQMNKRQTIQFSGPYQVARSAKEPAAG